jgi:hypothetical protein
MKDRSPLPWEWWEPRPMIEAGAASTEEVVSVSRARPTGDSHGRTTYNSAQRGGGAKRRAAPRKVSQGSGAAKDSMEAGVLHLASLRRGSLILRESSYNVVTPAPTVGNDSVVPDSKRERGVHARYALLGTGSAGGGRRPGDCLGAVPIGPPLALAARCGPGLTHRRLPRPANGERGAG